MFDDFIRGLRSDVRRFVEDHAPKGWWTNIHDLYQKALDFGFNGLASNGTRDRSPDRGAQNVGEFGDSRERRYAGKKQKAASGRQLSSLGLLRRRVMLVPTGTKGCGFPKGRWQPARLIKSAYDAARRGRVGKDCDNPRS